MRITDGIKKQKSLDCQKISVTDCSHLLFYSIILHFVHFAGCEWPATVTNRLSVFKVFLLIKFKTFRRIGIIFIHGLDFEEDRFVFLFQLLNQFYQKENFKHAESIGYRRRSLATGKVNKMEILYWSPKSNTEKEVFDAMKETYEKIHTFSSIHRKCSFVYDRQQS